MGFGEWMHFNADPDDDPDEIGEVETFNFNTDEDHCVMTNRYGDIANVWRVNLSLTKMTYPDILPKLNYFDIDLDFDDDIMSVTQSKN